MNDLEIAAIVVALVGALRARRFPGTDAFEPRLDGNAVPLVAALLGGVLSLLYRPAPPWLAIAHGVSLGLVAAGTMTALKYVGDKLGTALSRAPSHPKNSETSQGIRR
ncbi:MAG: hypothetical protein MUF34_31285 [Polyangiaceae bacterium]|jgi:hypothetical protein|nr:hypothetical protein [Polyangiaceae bacterium]